jgi:DNA-binding NarL/FixJ family response regulator
MTRVLIVDDHRAIRLGVSALLDAEPDLEVCGAAATGEAALDLAILLHPDVVIMDLSMPGIGGLATTQRMHRLCPRVRVLVLTWHADEQRVAAAFDAGATGYLLKSDEHQVLLEAVHAVARGERRRPRPGG